MIEVYLIPFPNTRAIMQTLVLGLHTLPIIFMGFIPWNIEHMAFLLIRSRPSIMVYIVYTTVAIK